MRTEQKRFLQYVAIGVVSVICVAQATSVLMTRWSTRTARDASRILRNTLAEAAAEMNSDNELSVRLEQARALLVHARDAAADADRSLARASSLAGIVGAFVPVHPTFSHVAPGEVAKVTSALTTTEWLIRALPHLNRVANYRVADDLAGAPDEPDLFRRVYAARVGMLRAAEALASPPATINGNDLSAATQTLNRAITATEPLLRALDIGAPYGSFRSDFITAADRSAAAAATVRERLMSEPFLPNLTASF